MWPDGETVAISCVSSCGRSVRVCTECVFACCTCTVRTHQVLWCNFRRLVVSDWQVEAAPCSYHIVITTPKYRCYEYYSKHFHFFLLACFVFLCYRFILGAIIEFFYGFIFEMKIILIFDACCRAEPSRTEPSWLRHLFSHNSPFRCCDTLPS